MKSLIVWIYILNFLFEIPSVNLHLFNYKALFLDKVYKIQNLNTQVSLDSQYSNISSVSEVITYKYSYPSIITDSIHLSHKKSILHVIYNIDDYNNFDNVDIYDNMKIYSEDINIINSNIIENCLTNNFELNNNHLCIIVEFEDRNKKEEFIIMYEYETKNLIRQRENSYKGSKENIITWKINKTIGGCLIQDFSFDIFIRNIKSSFKEEISVYPDNYSNIIIDDSVTHINVNLPLAVINDSHEIKVTFPLYFKETKEYNNFFDNKNILEIMKILLIIISIFIALLLYLLLKYSIKGKEDKRDNDICENSSSSIIQNSP